MWNCRVPLPPSLTSHTAACWRQNGMACSLPVLLCSCCHCLLHYSAVKATVVVIVITIFIGQSFIDFLFAVAVAVLLPKLCCHCFCVATFAGWCTNMLLMPLLLVALPHVADATAVWWLLSSWPSSLVDCYFVLSAFSFYCGHGTLTDAAATALAVAVCPTVLAECLCCSFHCHFCCCLLLLL